MAESKAQNISSQLWAIANDLRGTMDASSFKDYILPFLFYKYLSIHQEEYLVNNDLVDISDGKSVNEAYKELVEEAGLEACLIDIAGTLGYAINPEDTWASLTESIHNGSVIPSDYQRLFENFNKNAEINKEAAADFRGIFNYINLGDSGLGSTTAGRTKTLNAVVTKIDEIEYKDENGKDILGEIYEYLIGKFAANAGKKGGEFYTPHEVSQILAKIVTGNIESQTGTFTVYDPTMGSGSLLLTVRNELPDGSRQGAVSFYGQELNTVTYNLARMNMFLHNINYNNFDIKRGDTLLNPQHLDEKPFDAIVSNPPYSVKWVGDGDPTLINDDRFAPAGKLAPKSKADFAFIMHSLNHLSNKGRAAIVCFPGIFYRGGAEKTIRQYLVDNNFVEAVIALPDNLFFGTSIATTILVLAKNKLENKTLFIDAGKEFKKETNNNVLTDSNIEHIVELFTNYQSEDYKSALVDNDVIGSEQDYNLSVSTYVEQEDTREKIDIDVLNKEIAETVAKIDYLRAEIDKIVEELSYGK